MRYCEHCGGEIEGSEDEDSYCSNCSHEANPEDIDPMRKREEEIGDTKLDIERNDLLCLWI